MVNNTTGSMFFSLCALKDLSCYHHLSSLSIRCWASSSFGAAAADISPTLLLLVQRLRQLHPCSRPKSSHPCLSSAFCSGPRPEGLASAWPPSSCLRLKTALCCSDSAAHPLGQSFSHTHTHICHSAVWPVTHIHYAGGSKDVSDLCVMLAESLLHNCLPHEYNK